MRTRIFRPRPWSLEVRVNVCYEKRRPDGVVRWSALERARVRLS